MRCPDVAVTVIVASTCLLVPNPALAQQLSFGPLAGVAISTWRGSDILSPPDYRTGFTGGGFVRVAIFKYFGLETELLYARKGMEETGTFCPFGNPCQPLMTSYAEDFIEIPLLFTTAVPIRLSPTIFAGPAVAFLTSCTSHSSLFGSVPCDSIFSGNPGSGSQPPTPSLSHKDFLWVFGGEFHLGAVAVQARYDLGQTQFLTLQGRSLDYRTRAWLMTAAYRLPLGRP